MPLILWILVFAFMATIVFSWGMGGFKEKVKSGVLGIVEGEEISYDYYEQMVERQAAMHTQQYGQEPADQVLVEIRNSVWDNIVRSILVRKEAQRMGIIVTNAEVADQVMNYPPDFLVQNEFFQTDGQFDIRKYRAFLQNPANREQVIFLEENYRQTMLERKLLLKVMGTVEVTDAELRRRFEERNVQGKAKFLMFSADSTELDSSVISDDMMEEYYYANLDQYYLPDKKRIVYAEFTNETSYEDSVDVEELAQEIKTELQRGEDFGYLAVIYSDHHTAPDSGDLGWIPQMQLEQESDSAVQATEPGNFTGPIINRYGVHFYLVEDRGMQDGEMKSKLRIIQLKYMPSADTQDIIRNQAMNFAEEIKERDFVQVCQAYNMEACSSGFFDRQSGFIPGLGKHKAASEFCFEKLVGATSEIYPLRNGWLVFKIIEEEPKHYKPLEEVRKDVFTKLYRQKKLDVAEAQCEEFIASLGGDISHWEEAAIEAGLEIKETENFFRFKDFVRDVGRDYNFSSVLFRMEVGGVMGPLIGKNGCYLVELTDKKPIDEQEFEENKNEHLPELEQNKREMVYKTWYSWLLNKSNIEDFRYMYYRRM